MGGANLFFFLNQLLTGQRLENSGGGQLKKTPCITTLDFHFLSHYSYIKSNHWTHLLATCIPYVQDSAR